MLDKYSPQTTAVISFFSALIAVIINNCFINRREKRQSEIQRLESQIKELYTPLLNLVEQSNNIYEKANNLVQGKIPENRKNFAELNRKEQEIWDFFVEEYFIPIHRKTIELVISNSHLLKGIKPLSDYKKFWEYASDLEARHTLYKKEKIDTRDDAEAAEYPVTFSQEIEGDLKEIHKELNDIRQKPIFSNYRSKMLNILGLCVRS